MIYVVLGMHKSGTTLVAEVLHKSGIKMIGADNGDPDYDTGNKYERISTASLNKDLLKCWDFYSLDVLPKDLSSQAVNIGFQSRARKIIDHQYRGTDSWGFKDPRTCLTYGQWRECLPEHKLIIVYRHPAQVMKHYEKRNRRRKKASILYKSLKAWIVYNRQILKILEITDCEYLVMNFEKFMSGHNELCRLEKFVGHSLNDARDLDKYKMKNSKHLCLSFVDIIQRTVGGRESYNQILREYLIYQEQQ